MADPYIGEIRLFGFNFNPRGWSYCAGALLPIATNSTLFSLLGTMYGGDGRTTFALPDLRGRAPISKGRHPGSYYDWRQGQQGGAETHTLTLPELASHNHTATITGSTMPEVVSATATLYAEKGGADTTSAADNLLAAVAASNTYKVPASAKDNQALSSESIVIDPITIPPTAINVSGAIANNGGSQAFSILQPTLAVNFCIAMIGIYPPRS